MTTPPETWTLVLSVPTDGPVPPAVRMRMLLKRALRDYGVKCIAARDRQPGDPAPGTFDVATPPPEPSRAAD